MQLSIFNEMELILDSNFYKDKLLPGILAYI